MTCGSSHDSPDPSCFKRGKDCSSIHRKIALHPAVMALSARPAHLILRLRSGQALGGLVSAVPLHKPLLQTHVDHPDETGGAAWPGTPL